MNTSSPSPDKSIIIWLLSGCLLIYLMVVVGGITRLSGSGLSITEWNVIMGAVPPLSQQDWQDTYQKYQQSPQFQKVNYDMKLDEFKSIFFWEYLHRLIGRLLGIVFIIPFFYFLVKKKLESNLIKKLLVIFLLGGLQGFIGWYMVKSGLIDNPHVSHYRLATHLITAFITFGFTFYVALGLIYEPFGSAQGSLSEVQGSLSTTRRSLSGAEMNKSTNSSIIYLSRILLLLGIIQIIYGSNSIIDGSFL